MERGWVYLIGCWGEEAELPIIKVGAVVAFAILLQSGPSSNDPRSQMPRPLQSQH